MAVGAIASEAVSGRFQLLNPGKEEIFAVSGAGFNENIP